MAGYPELSTLVAAIGGIPSSDPYGFHSTLNSTSNSSRITLFAPINSAFARFENSTGVMPLLTASYISPTHGNVTLLETIAANHVLTTYANSTVLTQLLATGNSSRHLLLDLDYGKAKVLTLAGLNVTVRGVVQTGTELPVPPLIFVENALVLTTNAIVAANGVVHLISNLIDPFIGATGGFFGPTEEVVKGVETTYGPIIRFAIASLNLGGQS